MAEKLTNKQRAFVTEYLRDYNGTRAAIRAGYSAKSASVQGSETLAIPKVRAAVDKVMEARRKRYASTPEKIMEELGKLSYHNMQDYFRVDSEGKPSSDFSDLTPEQWACISEITTDTRIERDHNGDEVATIERVKFKIADKGVNLERLGKHFKMFTDKLDLNGDFTAVIKGQDAKIL